MNTFSSLLRFRKGKAPADALNKARVGFPNRVSQSRMTLRDPARSIPPSGKHFIIGIASYAAGELELLDQLEDALDGASEAPDVEVFDVLDCQAPGDFDRYIPGIDAVHRTPVIGVICDGKLVDQATGLSDVASTLRRFNVLHR